MIRRGSGCSCVTVPLGRSELSQLPIGLQSGGEGIRTPDRDSPMPVFKTGAFNRSATPPVVVLSYRLSKLDECLLLKQADHRGDGFLHQPPVFFVK